MICYLDLFLLTFCYSNEVLVNLPITTVSFILFCRYQSCYQHPVNCLYDQQLQFLTYFIYYHGKQKTANQQHIHANSLLTMSDLVTKEAS